jgi:predicted dehydrogenase
MLNVGIVGYGYWGPKLARNISSCKNMNLVYICDSNLARIGKAIQDGFSKEYVDEFNKMLCNHPKNYVDLVVIATSCVSHYNLANKALDAGKHVLIEKPMTATVEEAERLIEKAEKNNLRLFVDHTFLFTSAVTEIKKLIDSGELGKPWYYDATRINLGIFQTDVTVTWDLAVHDIAIVNFLFNEDPVSVAAHGVEHFPRQREDGRFYPIHYDMAYIIIQYGNIIFNMSAKWVSPVKIRTTIIGGSEKSIVWDDTKLDRKIEIHDKMIVPTFEDQSGQSLGNMWCPRIDTKEALLEMCNHIYECINTGNISIIDGKDGLKVVKILTTIDKSLNWKGHKVEYN